MSRATSPRWEAWSPEVLPKSWWSAPPRLEHELKVKGGPVGWAGEEQGGIKGTHQQDYTGKSNTKRCEDVERLGPWPTAEVGGNLAAILLLEPNHRSPELIPEGWRPVHTYLYTHLDPNSQTKKNQNLPQQVKG